MRIPSRDIPIIIAVLCDVPYPGEGLVATFFDNLEVAYLDARYRKVRNLKLHRDGCSLIDLLLYAQPVSVFLFADKTIANPPPRTLGRPK